MATQSASMIRPSEVGEKPNSTINEWARIPAACEIAGLSRSTLYANFDISGGQIKTASIRRRGLTRGIRMVNIPSLLAFIASFAEEPSPAPQTKIRL